MFWHLSVPPIYHNLAHHDANAADAETTTSAVNCSAEARFDFRQSISCIYAREINVERSAVKLFWCMKAFSYDLVEEFADVVSVTSE